MLHEGGQNVEGAAAKPHRPVAFERQALLRKEPERSERDRLCVHAYGAKTIPPYYLINLTSEPADTKSTESGQSVPCKELCRRGLKLTIRFRSDAPSAYEGPGPRPS
jgi:hypothetical protein